MSPMAAAALGDARIPCPLCGGLIHPIAGKCKHCKQDLAPTRLARPSAPSALPSIVATNVPAALGNGHSNGHSHGHLNGHANGQAAYAPHAYSPMPRTAEDGMSPVLPPRVSARMYAAQ